MAVVSQVGPGSRGIGSNRPRSCPPKPRLLAVYLFLCIYIYIIGDKLLGLFHNWVWFSNIFNVHPCLGK